jgi:hypothetical protein
MHTLTRSAFVSAARLLVVWGLAAGGTAWGAQHWSVPLAGNTFRTAPGPGSGGLTRSGHLRWGEPQEVYSVFFRVDRPAQLQLSLVGRAAEGTGRLRLQAEGQTFAVSFSGDESHEQPVGQLTVERAGYIRLDLQGEERDGASFAELETLVIGSATAELSIDFVRDNSGNMFYWGRRGPSVHLRYQVPRDLTLQYAYSEISVPAGEDPIGSFYMANGFSEGYFGIQVNGPDERRVLFSVWSPFTTDNPRDIPPELRIEALAIGPQVRVGEFGNEGSGGQSYLVYPWRAGATYRFLTEVRPDGARSTTYTAWFGEVGQEDWRLIASFRRPQTDTHLRGFHAFLESFSPQYGHLQRLGRYGNVWVVDTTGQWHECVEAHFSVDPTGGNRHRLDYAGGVEGEAFYLKNCGFFASPGRPGSLLTRPSTAASQPHIDFDQLPRGD